MDGPSELSDSKLVPPGRELWEKEEILFSVERCAL